MRKHYELVSFKALPDKNGRTNRFEAIVAVFGNVDLVGDRVDAKAFDNHLSQLRDIGDPIPIIWSHDWGNPFAHIGWADPKEAEATEKGLKLIGYMDTDPFAAQVYKLLKERRVKEFSFAYDVVREKRASDGANELLELRLIEAGPTLKGANPETELVGVKNALEDAAHKKNIYEPLPGSDEARRTAVQSAVQEWGEGAYPPDADGRGPWFGIAATFPDRVIVAIEKPGEETEYVEFNYSMNDDGADLTDGPNPVDVTVTVTPKSTEAAKKSLEEALTVVESAVSEARALLTADPEPPPTPTPTPTPEPVPTPTDPEPEPGTTQDLLQKIALLEVEADPDPEPTE